VPNNRYRPNIRQHFLAEYSFLGRNKKINFRSITNFSKVMLIGKTIKQREGACLRSETEAVAKSLEITEIMATKCNAMAGGFSVLARRQSSANCNCADTRSGDHVVLEDPNSDAGDNSSSSECSALLSYSSYKDCHRVHVGESVCRPRKPVYMVFLMLVPLLILAVAYI
jgi:hypothetical protein